MNERLRTLRKTLGLTQAEFSKNIGIKRNSYANYEVGRNHPIDAVIFSICREYHVSETWLRYGEGEMFLPLDDEAKIQRWVRDTFTDETAAFKRRFALMMSELAPWQWEELEKAAYRLAGRPALEENRFAEKLEKHPHGADKNDKKTEKALFEDAMPEEGKGNSISDESIR